MPEDLKKKSTRRERYTTLGGSMFTERATFDAHWREIADFVLPRRIRLQVTDRNKGDRRNQNIIDGSGTFASRTLASGLHAGLTSPARPWFKLTTPDPDLAEHGPVKEWLHQVTQRMRTVFQRANLYNALPIVYGDMGNFATAAIGILEDSRDLFRAYTYPIGSYALGIDRRGLVTTFVRDYEMTVRQIVEEFGVRRGYRDIDWSNISTTVKDQWDRSNYEHAVQVRWVVLPNEEADANRLESKYLPWASCHFETGSEPKDGDTRFLRESGFRTFPFMCPRWDVTSSEDVYGTDCPGMLALGDIKQLQLMQKKKAQGIAKQVDPPVQGPSALRTQKTSLLAGDITYVDVREANQGLRPVHEVNINLADMTADIREVQYRISRAYYEDLFLMLATSDRIKGTQPPTAREIEERHEEKLLALGPVLERTNDELLDPLIDRVYGLMELNGLIPEVPEELDQVALKVEYISILAQAQKLVGIVGQDRLLQSVIGIAEVFPEALAKINAYQIVDNYADMLGTDPRVVRPTEEAEANVNAQKQAQAEMAAAQQAEMLAGAANKAANAPMDTDNALARMVGQ